MGDSAAQEASFGGVMRAKTPEAIRREIIDKIKLRRSLRNKMLAFEHCVSVSTISKIWKHYLTTSSQT